MGTFSSQDLSRSLTADECVQQSSDRKLQLNLQMLTTFLPPHNSVSSWIAA